MIIYQELVATFEVLLTTRLTSNAKSAKTKPGVNLAILSKEVDDKVIFLHNADNISILSDSLGGPM